MLRSKTCNIDKCYLSRATRICDNWLQTSMNVRAASARMEPHVTML